MDIFLMGVATENELKLWSRNLVTNNVNHIVSYDALSSRKVADAHLNDPALSVRYFIRAPLLDVFLHGNIFWLPVVGTHI